MAPKSLLEMCLRVATQHAETITSLAGVPSCAIPTILKGVKTAKALSEIEANSDDIYDQTGEHWERIIKKDFPSLYRKHRWVPENPRSWFKVWKKYKQVQDEEAAKATEELVNALEAEQSSHKRAIIISSAQARRLPQPRAGGSRQHWTANLSSEPRPKTVFQKLNRQVREESRRFRLATASGRAHVQQTQITQAPKAMIENIRRERQFDPAATLIRPARKPAPASTAATKADRERAEREERLRRIKDGGKPKTSDPPAGNVISFDDDDDDEGGQEAPRGKTGILTVDDLLPSTNRTKQGNLTKPPRPSSKIAGGAASVAPSRHRQGGGGLLSAAPGANSVRSRTSPPTSTPPSNAFSGNDSSAPSLSPSGSVQRKVLTPKGPSTMVGRDRSPPATKPPAAASPPLRPMKRRVRNDPLMVANKRPR